MMRGLTRPAVLAAAVTVALILSSALAQTAQLSASSRALDMSPLTIDKGLTGMTWDGKEFIATYGTSNVPLINVSLDGKVTPFAPKFVGKDECYPALSIGKAGFPAGYLYVNSDPSIYQVDPTGSSVTVFSTPPGSNRIAFVAFDTVGSWGYALFALDDNGLLWSIKSDGTSKVIANVSTFANAQSSRLGLKPEGIAVAPQSFGAFSGFLFVTLEGAGRVLAIPPNGTKVTPVAMMPGEEPERVLQIPAASDLYLAEWGTGDRVRVPAANFSNYVGSLLVVTEGENEPFGSFNVLQPSGNNVTLARIGTVTGAPHFEGASFVPASLYASVSATGSQPTVSGGASAATLLVGGLAVLAVVVVAVFFVSRRGRAGP